MHLHLYRPVTLWRDGALLQIENPFDLTPYERALLIERRLATFTQPTRSDFGESMTEDVSSVLKLITPPASEPITLSQAKLFLRVEHTADDEAITRAIAAARLFAERHLRAALLPQVWDYTVANPCTVTIRLPFGPAQSITSVTLTDAAGASTTAPVANYRLSVDGYAVIFGNVPSVENVTIRFSASIAATVADVPALIVQGMLHHIAVMMESRDGAAPLPMQAVSCYEPYRRISL